ncbi:hypothetical protein COLO4_10399 [Corchorus olitorius]|uniref:AP2/ERF domain-containing protein n=1 Tax=Corchorus olitorius TaxID=93759 RepID=A0A1R3K8Q7_9ROSI|nr:hypothetical protein COLO4_10399 [Corchorus olitorius]
MEDEASSMVSNAKFNFAAETSDSGNSNYPLRASKRARHEITNIASSSSSSARSKGVVPQQNGHWGAQIYANHQRIWLGTFKSEKEAAMAYDSAAIKLRSGDSHRNFPWSDQNIQEPNFQNLYTTEDVLNMIRDGSYQAKFAEYINIVSESKDGVMLGSNVSRNLVLNGDVQFSCMQLFQKELTPSDVGKLNRLVIPKKYAVKYFPYICENDQVGGNGVEDIELVFYDKLMRTWKFRYCYWRSSQSFVFTRGWNRFVKEKKLREKDIITFYTCECPAAAGGGENFDGQNFFLIDVNHYNDHDDDDHGEQSNCINTEGNLVFNKLGFSSNIGTTHEDLQQVELELELELNLGKNFNCRIESGNSQLDEENEALSGNNVEGKRIVTLFGVQIN